jgi:hypothetical protein
VADAARLLAVPADRDLADVGERTVGVDAVSGPAALTAVVRT